MPVQKTCCSAVFKSKPVRQIMICSAMCPRNYLALSTVSVFEYVSGNENKRLFLFLFFFVCLQRGVFSAEVFLHMLRSSAAAAGRHAWLPLKKPASVFSYFFFKSDCLYSSVQRIHCRTVKFNVAY